MMRLATEVTRIAVRLTGLAAILLLVFFTPSTAGPKSVPPGAHKVYQFTLAGCPPGLGCESGCDGSNRLVVDREARGTRVLVANGVSWSVSDCDAASDNCGEITTDEVGKYGIFLRILGAHDNVSTFPETYEDAESGEALCLLAVIDLTRSAGQSKFRLEPSAIFDAGLSELVWSTDAHSSVRIAQLRVYEMP